ncbi:putative quinol monooxygenase [Qipengyuania marisflavi]|uniref:Antibiotic biosynthesis monooxygenase n=1 Tax=Qipengyuania marisflavi TaxID=2486356 RepID=A0A5S3P765_9SPHN|nr:putative quinol monooxygenase [Qipengyuania marisflavi]TMM48985.1 antibiotic biosynthesis monooxygenase [Qipengyuania marisflavi]
MIVIAGTVRIAPGSLDRFRDEMTAMIEASRAENGCIRYAYAIDTLDAGIMHVAEAWRDMAALKAHFTAPHMADWQKVTTQIGVTERNLVLYKTDEGKAL